MELTMKMADVMRLNSGLKLIIDDTTAKIDVLFKFKLLGIMKNIQSYVENFNKIRDEKIKEYGKENEDGTIGISLDDKDTIKKFNQDLEKLLNSTVKVNIEKLKASEVFNQGVPSEYLIILYDIMEG